MEISILCGIKVHLYMQDVTQRKVVHYQSYAEDHVKDLMVEEIVKEIYTNEDVLPSSIFIPVIQYERINNKKNEEQSDSEAVVSTIYIVNILLALISSHLGQSLIKDYEEILRTLKTDNLYTTYQSTSQSSHHIQATPKYQAEKQNMSEVDSSPSLGKRSKRSYKVKDLCVNIPSHNKILEAQMN